MMLAPIRTIAPSEKPVTLAQAKAHLRVDHDDDDTLIGSLIDAAVGYFDGYSGILGRALVAQTWRQDYPGFCQSMLLPVGPSNVVSAVTYYNGANVQQTLAPATYQIQTGARGPFVSPAAGKAWPVTAQRADAVSITFIAGQSVSEVPAPIKQAILLLIGQWFETREPVTIGAAVAALPFAVDALIAPYRRVGF
jgi:uncharacterized phiE125 gp8 family phage protein